MTPDLSRPEWTPLDKALSGLTPRQRKLYLRKLWRQARKKLLRAEARKTPSPEGYCCPRCHEWYPTPEQRQRCRANHRSAS